MRVEGHVSQFGGQPVMSLQEAVAQDHAPTDARADRQIKRVMVAASRAELPFGQSRQVGVVIQKGGDAEAFHQIGGEGEVAPFLDVGRRHHHARARIERPRRRNADGVHLARPNRFHQRGHAVEDFFVGGVGFRALVFEGNLAVGRISGGAQVRPAHIYGNHVSHAGHYNRGG